MRGLTAKILCVLAWLIAASAASATHENCLRVASLPNVSGQFDVVALGTQIFETAGLCADIVEMPVQRSERLTLDGALDGQLMRTKVWADLYAADMTLVPTPLLTEEVVMLSVAGAPQAIMSLDDLRGKTVGISMGHRWAQRTLTTLGARPVEASSVGALGVLIGSGKVDIGIIDRASLTAGGEVPNLTVTPIAAVDYHIVLRNEYAHHVSELDAALRRLHGSAATAR